jgi:O-antigen/teichoic acid export membrane protein
MTAHDRPRAREDLAWGICAQFMQYGAALLLLPFLAAKLPSATLGLWFVFMTIQSLVLLIDLGLGHSLARSFSYVFAGARQLLRHGVYENTKNVEFDPDLVSDTVYTAKLIYGIVALAVGVLLLGPGTLYVHSLGVLSTSEGIAAWGIYALAILFNVYFQWYLPVLIGSGKLRENYKATVIVRGGFVLLAAGLLQIRAELWVVSISYLVSVLIMLIYVSRQAEPLLKSLPIRQIPLSAVQKHFNILWHNSYRTGLVSIGAFLITRYSVLLVSSHYGLELAASYAFTLQVFSAITSLSLVPFGAFLPRMAALRLNGQMLALRHLLVTSFIMTWTLSIVSIVLVVLLGNTILAMLNAKTELLPLQLLVLIGVTVFLEINHGASAMVISAMNRVPFVPAALISGVFVCALSTWAAQRDEAIWVMIAIQTITQLAYNNWKWPYVVFKEFQFSFSDFAITIGRAAHILSRTNNQ